MRDLDRNEIAKMEKMLAAMQRKCPSKQTLDTAIYARKSSEDTNQTSIPTQIEECREIIEKNSSLLSLTDDHIYTEDKKSGMFADNRTALQEMLDEARKGKINVIIVYHHDRLTRRVGDYDKIKEELRKLKVMLVFGNLPIDDDTSTGEYIVETFYTNSQREARVAAEKTADTLRKNVKDGKSAGGCAPYGLQYANKQFFPNPNEAPNVKLMFNIVANGGTYEKILSEFAKRGVTTKSGKEFSYSTISDMLRNKKYMGTYVYCRKDEYGDPVNKKGHRVLLGEQEEIENDEVVVGRIVSRELFEKVQKILDGRELSQSKSNAFPDYLLSGLVKCECGSPMYGESTPSKRGKGRYRYYACKSHRRNNGCSVKKISAETLETFVKKAMAREITAFIAAGNFSADGLKKIQTTVQGNLGRTSRRISDTENLNGKLAVTAANIPQTALEPFIKKIEQNQQLIKCLQDYKKTLETKKTFLGSIVQNPAGFTPSEDELFADNDTARQLVRAFVKEIIVGNEDIKIRFNN